MGTPSRVSGEVGLILMFLIGCTSMKPPAAGEATLVERVLTEKALRDQLVERGTGDAHFVHEVLHQLGKGPDGDQRFARLLAEHLGHHVTTARAVFEEFATRRQFQEWIIERLRDRKAAQ